MRKSAFFAVFLVLFLIFPMKIKGSSAETALDELYDSLPDEISKELPESSSDGNGIGIGYVIEKLEEAVNSSLEELFSPCIVLFGMIIICGMLRHLGTNLGQISEGASFTGEICLLLALFGFIKPIFKLLYDTVSGMGLFIKSLLPIMTALYAASGDISASAVNTTWLTLILTFLEELCAGLMTPLLYICLGFMTVSAMSRYMGNSGIGELSSTLRNTFILFLSSVGLIFTGIMSYQTVIARGRDRLALRSIRFASGNLIPIIGGAVGEAADGYLTSISIIKGNVGELAVTALMLYVMPVIIKISVMRLGLSFASFTAGLFGCTHEAETIKEAGSCLGFGLSIAVLSSVMLVIVVGVFSSASF